MAAFPTAQFAKYDFLRLDKLLKREVVILADLVGTAEISGLKTHATPPWDASDLGVTRTNGLKVPARQWAWI